MNGIIVVPSTGRCCSVGIYSIVTKFIITFAIVAIIVFPKSSLSFTMVTSSRPTSSSSSSSSKMTNNNKVHSESISFVSKNKVNVIPTTIRLYAQTRNSNINNLNMYYESGIDPKEKQVVQKLRVEHPTFYRLVIPHNQSSTSPSSSAAIPQGKKVPVRESNRNSRAFLIQPPPTSEKVTIQGFPQDVTSKKDSLYYYPFYEQQIQYMKEQLTNLQQIPVVSKTTGHDMSYKESIDGTGQIYTAYFTSDEYKLIRLTMLDNGNQTHVYTSLWYPNPQFNLPLLGIDLLRFNNGKKTLCISDFQPLHTNEEDHDSTDYESTLKPIKDQYPLLQNSMTNRFYNSEEIYFSKHSMLLGRYNYYNSTATSSTTSNIDDGLALMNGPDDMVFEQMLPATKQYMQTHITMVQEQFRKQQQQHEQQKNLDIPPRTILKDETQPKENKVQRVLKRHAAYDTYAATYDPAHALLSKLFGAEWADNYLYDILFPLSTRPSSSSSCKSDPV